MDLRALHEEAVGFHRRGDLARAEPLYRKLVSAAPADAEAHYLFAGLCFQQGRTEEALGLLDIALARAPRLLRALILKGVALQAASRFEEALASHEQVLAMQPGHGATWNNRGLVLDNLGRVPEALASFEKALAIDPKSAEAWNNRASMLEKQKRFAEALASAGRALALDDRHAGALFNRGVILYALQRRDKALAAFEALLAVRLDHAEAWYYRGVLALDLHLGPGEALASLDRALALRPDYAEAWDSRGVALNQLRRWEEAAASYDKAIALKPDYADAWNNRAVTLFLLQRIDEARANAQSALTLNPDHAGAAHSLGIILCEEGRIDEGFALWRREAQITARAQADRVLPAPAPHRLRHDTEQLAYLAADPQAQHLADGTRLAGPAVNQQNAARIEAEWAAKRPPVVVIDDFLTPEALEKLRRFCWGAPVWGKSFRRGYLGSFPEHGFASPLLAQIADELRLAYPAIFCGHGLRYAWGFKYDSSLEGIAIHADQAAVNVNFWITPDEANLDPESGGLVIWDVPAPLDWEITKYNGDDAACREFLAREGARATRVPYRANRAVIFNSDLFHETDRIVFKDGYLNRRINVTLLYGARSSREG